MTLFEENTHVFIVRVWRERREIPGASAEWRGMVRHVPTGEQRYVNTLEEIIFFMVNYLPGVRVKLGVCWRARQWMSQWSRRGSRKA